MKEIKKSIEGIDIRSLFARNVKRLRNIAKLSQINLAAAANLTHNFINDIENGKKWVSPESMAKLAAALRAEPYQFFISDPKWNSQGAEMFSLYLNEFETTFGNMVKEYRSRYLPEDRGGDTREGLSGDAQGEAAYGVPVFSGPDTGNGQP